MKEVDLTKAIPVDGEGGILELEAEQAAFAAELAELQAQDDAQNALPVLDGVQSAAVTLNAHVAFLLETESLLEAWVKTLGAVVAGQRPAAEQLVREMRARAAPMLPPERFPLAFDTEVNWLLDIGKLAVAKAAAEKAHYLDQYRLHVEAARPSAAGPPEQ